MSEKKLKAHQADKLLSVNANLGYCNKVTVINQTAQRHTYFAKLCQIVQKDKPLFLAKNKV